MHRLSFLAYFEFNTTDLINKNLSTRAKQTLHNVNFYGFVYRMAFEQDNTAQFGLFQVKNEAENRSWTWGRTQ